MPRSSDGRWTATCEVCGKEFQQGRPGVRTCGALCRAKLPHNTGGSRYQSGLDSRTCPVCGKQYQPYRDNQVACSRECLLKTPQHREVQRRSDSRPERQQRKNELRRTVPERAQKVREYNRKKQLARYGITPDEYERKWEEQDGKCKICGQVAEPGGVRAASKLHADHDHATGKNRDLLCLRCNNGLGYFKDDPVLLRAAVAYIERHRGG